MNKHIIVFGLQRSGTNFLEQLLITNFDGLSLKPQKTKEKMYNWKHAYDFNLKSVDSSMIHVYVVKNPYVWIDSIIRKKMQTKSSFDALMGPYYNMTNPEHPEHDVCGVDIVNMARLWNDHATWFHSDVVKNKLQYQKVLYRDIVSNENYMIEFMKNVHDKWGLHRTHDLIEVPIKVDQSATWTEEQARRYRDNILEYIPRDKLPLINKELNDGILRLCKVEKRYS